MTIKTRAMAFLLAAMMGLAMAVPAEAAVPDSKAQKDLANCAAADYDPLSPACWAMSWDSIQDWSNPPVAS